MHLAVNARFSDTRDDDAVGMLLRTSREKLVDLSILVGGLQGRRLLSACLLVQSPGRVGMIFTPNDLLNPLRKRLLEDSVRFALDMAWAQDIQIVEALLAPTGGQQEDALLRAGFRYITTLHYLNSRVLGRHGCSESRHGMAADELTSVSYTSDNVRLFRTALKDSYEKSLDCPELSEMRTLEDVLQTHAARRGFDPDLWRVFRRGTTPAGLILLNPIEDLGGQRPPGGVELAYLGVAQPFRGKGVADAMLRWAFSAVRQLGATTMTLAVDERNTPARRLYARWGFHEAFRRRAMLHPRPADRQHS